VKAVCLHDRDEIERYLRQNTFLHIYSLGDLDDFFWQYTTWYAFKDDRQQITQLALVYTGMAQPVLLGITEDSEAGAMCELLRAIRPFLPANLYAHFSGDAASALVDSYRIESHGLHYKMALTDTSRLDTFDTSRALALTAADLSELQRLYASYPGNAFDPRMLETGQFFGIRRHAQLACVAGIHVYSPRYRVAAIGNVTTHPAFRNQGLATSVCARLCQSLLQTVDHVGLNVKADNAAAIRCYEQLGFARIASYTECDLIAARS
jgi:ribosomal protein S18 acetylase RimI-like enzyme